MDPKTVLYHVYFAVTSLSDSSCSSIINLYIKFYIIGEPRVTCSKGFN